MLCSAYYRSRHVVKYAGPMATNPDPQQALERLLTGVRRFRKEEFPSRRDLYAQITRDGQRPHTLFITCADSRLDPELLTQSGPGDIFVTRNIGNLVPAYGEMLGGVSAVIEYATVVLGVEQIVVCGHTDCGAIKALINRDSLTAVPIVNNWLRNADAAYSIVQSRNTARNQDEMLNQLVRENVLMQVNHLRTHPSVAGRLARGGLALHAWVYDIANGYVQMY